MLVSELITLLQSKKQNEKVLILCGKYAVKELELEDCVEFKNKVSLYKDIEDLYAIKENEIKSQKVRADKLKEEKDKLDN